MKRADGAKAWSRVLSELAQVKVSVGWERPTWRVSWQDGPTREALMRRAAALGEYRVGAPLPCADLRFARSSSTVAPHWRVLRESTTTPTLALLVSHRETLTSSWQRSNLPEQCGKPAVSDISSSEGRRRRSCSLRSPFSVHCAWTAIRERDKNASRNRQSTQRSSWLGGRGCRGRRGIDSRGCAPGGRG